MQSSKTPGISRTLAPLPRGWASCWGVTLPWGRSTAEATLVAQIGGVQGGGGGGVAGGGADGQHPPGPGPAHQEVEVAQGRGHAPVLEGGAGVLAVVFEVKGGPHLAPEVLIGGHLGGVAFAQVDDVAQRDDRGDELVVEKNPLESRHVEHLAVIEEPPPEGPGSFFKTRLVFVHQAGRGRGTWGRYKAAR